MKSVLLALSVFALSAPAFATGKLKCTDYNEGYEINGLLSSSELGAKPFNVTFGRGNNVQSSVKVVDYLESRKGEFLSIIIADPITNRILAFVEDTRLVVLSRDGDFVGRFGVNCEIN